MPVAVAVAAAAEAREPTGQEQLQGHLMDVLKELPPLYKAAARANEARLQALERLKVPRAGGGEYGVQVIRLDAFREALSVALEQSSVLRAIRNRARRGLRSVLVTEGMFNEREKKSADWLAAHVVNTLLDNDAARSIVLLDTELNDAQTDETLRHACAAGPTEAAPLLVVVLNDGAFTGKQQSQEVGALARAAQRAGIRLDVRVVVPYATGAARARILAAAGAAGDWCTAQLTAVCDMPGPFSDIQGYEGGNHMLSFFEHKGAPDSFPAEYAALADGAAGRPVYKDSKTWSAITGAIEALRAARKGLAA